MIHANEHLREGTKGYIIHNDQVVPVTVSSVQDISRHGSSCYVIHFKDIPKERFSSMYALYELADAKRDLSYSLQAQIDSLKIKRKELKTEIKTLKSILISLTN